MKNYLFVLLTLFSFIGHIHTRHNNSNTLVKTTYYVDPNGDDLASGLSPSEAWATFDHAMSVLVAGDELILADGIYYQTLDITILGTSLNPILIKAMNDGQATVDGEGIRKPGIIGRSGSNFDSYIEIEGIIFKNARSGTNDAVFHVWNNYNTFRRCSFYFAESGSNQHGLAFAHSTHNLAEDCIAAYVKRHCFMSWDDNGLDTYNTFRRCFATGYHPDRSDSMAISHYNIYGASFDVVENCIGWYGTQNYGISIHSQTGANYKCNNNKVYGSIFLGAGKVSQSIWYEGVGVSVNHPGGSAPKNIEIHDCISSENQMHGFNIGEQGRTENTIVNHCTMTKNESYAFRCKDPLTIIKNSIYYNNENGFHDTYQEGSYSYMNNFGNVNNNGVPSGENWPNSISIDPLIDSSGLVIPSNSPCYGTGEFGSDIGANICKRYVQGVLTNDDLWPWPMQDRILSELGIDLMAELNAKFGTLCTSAPPPRVTNTYYVSKDALNGFPAGNDNNDGLSESTAFATIQKAADIAIAGDTVYVKMGSYNEEISIQNSGVLDSFITFSAFPGHELQVIVDGTGLTVNKNADWPYFSGLIGVYGKNYIKIKGFKVQKSDAFGIIAYSADNIILDGNYTFNTVHSGIASFEYSSNIIVLNNEVEMAVNGGQQECISIAKTSDFEVGYNLIHDGTSTGNGGEGIDIKRGSSNGLVHHNEIWNIPASRTGIYLDAYDLHTFNIEIYSNTIHDIDHFGMQLASEMGGLLENIKIYNNIIYDNKRGGINFFDESSHSGTEPVQNIEIYNNTFDNNGLPVNWYGAVTNNSPYVSNVTIRNNICSNNAAYQIYNEAGGTNWIADHNLLFGDLGSQDQTRLNNGDDIEGDPLYIDAPNKDFHVQNTSPGIDAGVTAFVSDDYDGIARPIGSTHDIGAYETEAAGGGGCTFISIDIEDFELGWGIWNDGGSDARISISDSTYANSGIYCVRLRDNTSNSVITTNEMDLSGYNEIQIDFSYYVVSFEGVEDFWLQISTDGGATFTTQKAWVRGTDFNNNERHNTSFVIPGPFTGNTLLRFRCDATSNADMVYIDDIEVLGCAFTNGYNLTTAIIGNGRIDLNPSGGAYTAGTQVTLTATPDSGAQFNTWSGDISGSDNPTTVTIQSNMNITGNFTSVGACTYAIIDSQGFESGWGIWNDGGQDARRSSRDSAYANTGVRCIRLRDNTSTSTMTTDIMDLSIYDEITVEFSYFVVSFETNEDFWLQISTDGGTTYTTQKAWTRTTDFYNGERHSTSFIIPGPFSGNTKIRLRCDATSNGDKVYIDDVVIKGCSTPIYFKKIDENDLHITEKVVNFMDISNEHYVLPKEESLYEIGLYPNPVRAELTVDYRVPTTEKVKIFIYDITGNEIFQICRSGGDLKQVINMQNFAPGYYYLQFHVGDKKIDRSFIKINE